MVFSSPGIKNTGEALRLAVETAKREGIDAIVVASHSGATAERLLELGLAGIRVICVTAAPDYGTKRDPIMLTPEKRQQLEGAGVMFVRASHVLSGAERGLSSKFGGAYPVEIIAHTLRMLSPGLKVALEICVMALDAGKLESKQRVVAVGGTQVGADTVAVIRPAPAARILESRIEEIICKPR